jgi:hypothetical protein|tara:strand:+ start:247 stop:435 length:189 start_codon:yes stop_codon:yes gene_type:complete
MSKVSITFEDNEADDSIDVGVEFDPPLDDDETKLTKAQWAAIKAFEALAETSEQQSGEPNNG